MKTHQKIDTAAHNFHIMKKSQHIIAALTILLLSSCSSLIQNSKDKWNYQLHSQEVTFQLRTPSYYIMPSIKTSAPCNVAVKTNDLRNNNNIISTNFNDGSGYTYKNAYALPNEITLVNTTFTNHIRNIGFNIVEYTEPNYQFNINVKQFEIGFNEIDGWIGIVTINIDVLDNKNRIIYSLPDITKECKPDINSTNSKDNIFNPNLLALPIWQRTKQNYKYDLGSEAISKAFEQVLISIDYRAIVNEIENIELNKK